MSFYFGSYMSSLWLHLPSLYISYSLAIFCPAIGWSSFFFFIFFILSSGNKTNSQHTEGNPTSRLVIAIDLRIIVLTTTAAIAVMMLHKEIKISQAVLAHAFNPSTREAEAGRTLWVRGQPGLQELVSGQAPKLQRNPVTEKPKRTENI